MKKLVKITELKKQRVALGLSQDDLGQKIGKGEKVAISSIGGYERGDNPIPKDKADLLAKVLKTPFPKLFKPHPKLENRFLAK